MNVRWRGRVIRAFAGTVGIGVVIVLAVDYFRRDCTAGFSGERSRKGLGIALLRLLEQDKCEITVAALANQVYPSDSCVRGVSEIRPHVTG